MAISRRSLLAGGLSVPLAAAAARSTAFAASSGPFPAPLIVAVSGVDAGSAHDRVVRLVEPFLLRDIPLTLTVLPFDTEGRRLDHASKMATWLRECLSRKPEGIEIGIHLESIGTRDPYFQLRLASDAQAAFTKAVNDYARYRFHPVFQAMTVTTRTRVQSWEDCAAMRAAGIRSVIRLPGSDAKTAADLQPEDGGYWMTDVGLVNTFGSRRSSVRPAGNSSTPPSMRALASGIESLARSQEPIIIDVPFESLGGLSGVDLSSYGEALAQAVAEVTETGKVRQILPRALYRQSREKQRRFVVVRLDDLRLAPQTESGQRAFTRKLIEAGYPVSEAVVPGPNGARFSTDEDAKAFVADMFDRGRYDVSTHGWLHSSSELFGNSVAKNFRIVRDGVSETYRSTGRFPGSYVPPNNVFDQNALNALMQTGVVLLSADKGDFTWFSGLDRYGLLHASNTVMFEKAWSGDLPYHEMENVLSRIGEENDTVFSIHPRTANTPAKEQAIFDALETLSKQEGTDLVNFDEYYKAVVPALPGMQRIQRARADVVIRDWRPGLTTAVDALKKDAELAWSYFDWGARNFDGMVPATVWRENGRRQGYPFTTMWDVASYIMAAISAHRIGLIDEPVFESTAKRILGFLGDANFIYKGANLPPTERALRVAGGERDGFDSADTGRLLIALKILDSYSDGALGVSKLVSGWGFDAILTDGEMHMVKNGKASSLHANSYANYVAHGYRLWGYDLKPVFAARKPQANMDDAVATLAEVERRGRVATEPHVTEEIELGGSPHGQLMADVLYSAQMQRYAETGILTCVSEGPVAGEPFFVYQGYQIDGTGGSFVVDASNASSIRKTARMEHRLRAVSSKGAYLWNAARPGEYSTKLLELVRDRARMPGIGFSSGIAELTGKQFDVADVNTNGIILEAIAYILGGRRPFLTPDVGPPQSPRDA